MACLQYLFNIETGFLQGSLSGGSLGFGFITRDTGRAVSGQYRVLRNRNPQPQLLKARTQITLSPNSA